MPVKYEEADGVEEAKEDEKLRFCLGNRLQSGDGIFGIFDFAVPVFKDDIAVQFNPLFQKG